MLIVGLLFSKSLVFKVFSVQTKTKNRPRPRPIESQTWSNISLAAKLDSANGLV